MKNNFSGLHYHYQEIINQIYNNKKKEYMQIMEEYNHILIETEIL